MCQARTHDDNVITPEGEARRLQLYQWIVDDLVAGDWQLTTALKKWRDEVAQRVTHRATKKIRIPWIFVGILSLSEQFVLLCEDNAVRLIDRSVVRDHGPTDSRCIPGDVLVPRS